MHIMHKRMIILHQIVGRRLLATLNAYVALYLLAVLRHAWSRKLKYL
jgi:hypothetical protein